MFNKSTPVRQRVQLIRDHQRTIKSLRPALASQRCGRVRQPQQKSSALLRNNQSKSLWTHLIFMRIIQGKNTISRSPMVVNGLFNQIFALFTAIDVAHSLGRSHLVVGDFYVQFNVRKWHVPLSKIVQLSSLPIRISDWTTPQTLTCSSLYQHSITYPANAIEILQKETDATNLEVGCCLLFPLSKHTRNMHIQRMRFHPIFYGIVSTFLHTYPSYQVVHYRMENDFTTAFFKGWNFNTLQECRANLFQKYQDTILAHLDPSIPTLVVSHYYKDPGQPRDHDLQWQNLIHFTLSPEQKTQLHQQHLQLPPTAMMREVDAVIDFILCTTPNVRSFVGCANSTFSESVCLFRNYQNCSVINPHNM